MNAGAGRIGVVTAAACAVGVSSIIGLRVSGQEVPTSPCLASARIEASPKLVCPLEPVDLRLELRASCPEEAGGPAEVRSLHIAWSLPDGILPADSAGGGSVGPPAATAPLTWRFDRPPTSGITVNHTVRPIRPGNYALGTRLQVRIEDSLGRVVTHLVAAGDDRASLSVSGPCAPGKGASLFLPRVSQPRCEPSPQAADIVLLVDRSGSIGPGGLADAGRQAAAFFDGLNLGRDRVAVIAFDQRAELLAPLGSDRAGLERALNRLTLGPGTALDRAIDAGVAHLGLHGLPDRRRVLVLLSDGVQTGPRGPDFAIRAADVARGQGIAILTVALGPAPDRALLQRISSAPDYAINAPDTRDLGRAFRELAEVAVCATTAW